MQPPWYIGLSSLTQDKSSLHLHGRRKPQPHQPQQQECELFLLHLHCEPRGQSSQALLAFPVEAMRIHSLLAPHPAGLEQRRPGNGSLEMRRLSLSFQMPLTDRALPARMSLHNQPLAAGRARTTRWRMRQTPKSEPHTRHGPPFISFSPSLTPSTETSSTTSTCASRC
ncbi:hypothetical protein CCUS01_13252 [Colletotrichum cuscutae]|uniref:Uncharacterized protein n=1 Tax=Colletotrichum cuscutae TaxID=1209917 RepID=A0AAJ0DPP4_9PEZI|nr:hypothetical protein CCUS01_13252 [Colletotrichum cuscutae]